MVKHYPINGLGDPTDPTTIYPRLNINDFQTDPRYSKQWNLFLGALDELKKAGEDVDKPLGWYQIAGIHGTPYIQWMEEKESEDRPGDYCTHGTAIFLTWHRPYLLLLEQRIVEEALKLANNFAPDSKREYQGEAIKIRLPYWDWATDSNLPDAVRHPETTITLPKEGGDILLTKKIHNPLYSYKFKDYERRVRDMCLLPEPEFILFDETKRCPDLNGNSQPHIADEQLGLLKLREGMFKLLTLVSRYKPFSNTGAVPDYTIPSEFCPLEGYHNVVHKYTGTDYITKPPDPSNPQAKKIPNGHMGRVSVAGFDPIFWLHHSNVDRMYALWQAIRFYSRFEDQSTPNNRLPFTSLIDTAETTLRPFYRRVDGEPWTSFMVQHSDERIGPTTFDYGYTYPEIPRRAKNFEEQLVLSLKTYRKVRELYGPGDKFLFDAPRHIPDNLKSPENTRYRREWMIFLRVRKYLVDGDFIIIFFFGKVPESSYEWVTSENCVGAFSTFKSSTEYCANCSDQYEADALMNGGVDITRKLYEALEGTGIDLRNKEKVEEWLAKNLSWRILKEDRTELVLTNSRIIDGKKGLVVGVESFEMTYPPIDDEARGPDPDTDLDKEGLFGAVFDTVIHYKATEKNSESGGLKKGEPHLDIGIPLEDPE